MPKLVFFFQSTKYFYKKNILQLIYNILSFIFYSKKSSTFAHTFIFMSRDEKLKLHWDFLVKKISEDFADGQTIDIDGIIYLIGVQELGQLHRKFKKDDKMNLMHIAICKLLEPYGYYKLDFIDNEGWPHFSVVEELPPLKAGEQTILMKEAIVDYFKKNNYFPEII